MDSREDPAVEYVWRGSLLSFLLFGPTKSPVASTEYEQRGMTTCNPLSLPSLPVGARTIIGAVGDGWRALLPYVSVRGAGRRCEDDMPVLLLLRAIQIQADASRQLGTFMLLVVKCDEANIKTVRASWERHGRPHGVRALLEAEMRAGVQLEGRLEEGAALALLWSMRMKSFWIKMASGIADEHGATTPEFSLEAYAAEVEPYHGWLLRKIHRSAMRALPTRSEFIRKMATRPPERYPPAELTPQLRGACVDDLLACVQTTQSVIDHVKGIMDELQLHDTRQL